MCTMNERVGDVLAVRERMVGPITEQIRRQGYYVGHLDRQPHQALVDLRWAAQVAGRQLGKPTRTYTTAADEQRGGSITVIIAPREMPTRMQAEFAGSSRTTVEELLNHHHAAGSRQPA